MQTQAYIFRGILKTHIKIFWEAVKSGEHKVLIETDIILMLSSAYIVHKIPDRLNEIIIQQLVATILIVVF